MADAFMCGFGRYTDEAGKDGVSPTVTVTPISGGNRVEIADANGTQSFDVMDGESGSEGRPGKNGADGFSPTVTITEITGGTKVSITDTNGTKSFDVMNGQDGKDGEDGQDGSGSAAEIPYFDLTALGLPTIETNKTVYARVGRDDVMAIRTAMDKGQVKLKFTANATMPDGNSTGDETVEAFATANVVIFNNSDDNYYDCAIIKSTRYSTGYCFVAINIRFRLLDDGGHIEAASTVLGSTVATT